MGVIVAVIIAVIGGLVQSARHSDRLAVDVHMVWWMAVVGVASVLGAGYLVFDGVQTAELIGYTRGDGGFQWETAMGDLAIGVVGIMAYWFRGYFWLATIVVVTIRHAGNAAGHIFYSFVENHRQPYNLGILLSIDILLPIVLWTLYGASWRKGGDAVPKGVARQRGWRGNTGAVDRGVRGVTDCGN